MPNQQSPPPELIVSLRPVDAACARIFARTLRNAQSSASSSVTNSKKTSDEHSPKDAEQQPFLPVHVRLDKRPKDPRRGYTFGSNDDCDFKLGKPSQGFSACTFRITYLKVSAISYVADIARVRPGQCRFPAGDSIIQKQVQAG